MNPSSSLRTLVEPDTPGVDFGFINFTSGNDWLDPDTDRRSPQNERLCPNETEFIDACVLSDVLKLKRLLHTIDGKPSDRVISDKLVPAWSLLTTAIAQKQFAVLELLLKCYPHWDMCTGSIIREAFANPDVRIFKLLHSHSPGIINMELESNRSSPLMEACCFSEDPQIPNYLLNHGADVLEGGFLNLGPLWAAVTGNHSLALIQKMVGLGAIITSSAIQAAIRRQDLLILQYLLDNRIYESHQFQLKLAQETMNPDVVAMIEDRAKRLNRREKRIMAQELNAQRGYREGKSWWQLGR